VTQRTEMLKNDKVVLVFTISQSCQFLQMCHYWSFYVHNESKYVDARRYIVYLRKYPLIPIFRILSHSSINLK